MKRKRLLFPARQHALSLLRATSEARQYKGNTVQDDDPQTSDSITQDAIRNAAISVEVAAAAVINAANAAVSELQETAKSVEQSASDVAKAEAQQATDISAARLAEVRAQVLRDNAELKAGQYIKL